jgi:transposase
MEPALPPDEEIAALRAQLARRDEVIAARDAVIAAQAAALGERDIQLAAARLQIEQLQAQLASLRRQQYGRSSEKLDAAVEQLELRLEGLEEDFGAQDAAHPQRPEPGPEAKPKRPAAGHKPLPAHLPREVVVHEPAIICGCCNRAQLARLGENVTEVLEKIPARLKVIRHVRPRYACRVCERIFQAPAPDLPIEKGKPGPGLIAHVAVAKYCDGLPLYRQSAILAREGVEIDRATLADWIGHAAWWLTPLAELIGRHVMAQPVLWTDDTPIRTLAPGTGRTRLSRFWCYAVDPRPYAGQGPPAVLYRYSPDRRGERPRTHLVEFGGYLHADAYAGYKALYRRNGTTAPRVTHVACMAHARRKFFDVFEATGSPIAEQALHHIQGLYAIEAEINGLAAEQRYAVRQARSRPLLEALHIWCDAQRRRLSGKTALGKAFQYALSRWDALNRYIEDGRLSIDNNLAERLLRGIAVSRKNFLFVGSDAGGERAAVIYTLIESAKLSGLDPERYLAVILDRMATAHPANRLGELLPWNITLALSTPAAAA